MSDDKPEGVSSSKRYDWGALHKEHDWIGGQCPIDGECYVRVWLDNGKCLDQYAGILDWSNRYDGWDIVRYMILVDCPSRKQ
jgi:hypothetical protein